MTKQKALCVATRCTTAEQFIETFHRYCDEQSFFVATMNMRPVGLETPFSIQLADKSPVLRGLCVVLAAYTTAANPYKRPGIRLGIRRLTPESEAVFYQLQAMRTAAPQDVVNEEVSEGIQQPPAAVPVKVPPIQTLPRVSPPPRKLPIATPVPSLKPAAAPEPAPLPEATAKVEAKPAPESERARAEEAQRVPGSDFILPANPLMNLTDESLEGFVDCTLYEETANFFRADAEDDFLDPVAPPPPPAPPAPVEALPVFNPSSVIANAFPEESTSEPTIEKRPATPTVETGNPFRVSTSRGEPPPMPLPAPAEQIPHESSIKASLARVEHSVAQLLDSLDTSKPIDAMTRGTPMPAGEAYAREVAKRASKSRAKWVLFGGATLFVSAVVAVVFYQRSLAEEAAPAPAPETAAQAPDKPEVVADTTPVDKPVDPPIDKPIDKPIDQPITDVPKVDPPDGEEIAAVTQPTDPGAPVVGDGPCKLEVKTTPAGTMVQLDGNTIGPSPITIAGPCAKRRVDLAHARYKPEQRWVTLTPEKVEALDVTLVRPTHILTVTSNPSGATVSIGGRRAGTTPTKVPLMGFTGLEVKIEKPGFEGVTKKIYSKSPDDKISATLKRSLFPK